MNRIIIHEKLNSITNWGIYIFLILINVALIYLLFSGGQLMNVIYESDWFNNTAQANSGEDAFYLEKFGMMRGLGKYFVMISIIILAIILTYIIIAHINKDISGIALLHAIGYNQGHIFKYIAIKNLYDVITAGVLGYITAGFFWKKVVVQNVFKEIISRSGIDFSINWRAYVFCMVVVYCVQMAKTIQIYERVKRVNIKMCVEE